MDHNAKVGKSVWLTKHALTRGIVKTKIKRFDQWGNIWVPDTNRLNENPVYTHAHWHDSASAARDKADTMRVNKIRALQKQIARLEGLTF